MSFNGNEGEFISLTDGGDYTRNYRQSNPGTTQGHFLGANKINDLLNQSGCVGLRFYYGIDEHADPQLVVVGVDSNEDDILATTGPLILDRSKPCPPNCGSANELNS